MITHARVLPPEPVIPSDKTSVILALTELEALSLVSVLRKAQTNSNSTLTHGEQQFVNKLSNETGQALVTVRQGV